MRKPLKPYYFFNDKRAAVTSSWVRFGTTSYAVRSIMTLDFKTFQVPRPAKYALFFFSLMVVVVCGVVVVNERLPPWLAKSLLAGSLVVFAYAFALAFLKRVYYHITITMFDGTQAFNKRYKLHQAKELHDAITRAMDWHQSSSDGGQVSMIDTLASRRKAAKTGAWTTKKR